MARGPAALLIALAGCDPNLLPAVRGPGGVYRPGGACVTAQAGRDCPDVQDPASYASLPFESHDDPGLGIQSPATLSNLRVVCERSYCGTGALAVHGRFRWTRAEADDRERLGSLRHAFTPPVDLADRTLSLRVLVEPFRERGTGWTPMNAQVGVIHNGVWRWIGWKPLKAGWNSISGVVSPTNPIAKIDAGATVIPVSALVIDVYLSVPPASGGPSAWEGEIYLDDVDWR